jgi:hypothetical protein
MPRRISVDRAVRPLFLQQGSEPPQARSRPDFKHRVFLVPAEWLRQVSCTYGARQSYLPVGRALLARFRHVKSKYGAIQVSECYIASFLDI